MKKILSLVLLFGIFSSSGYYWYRKKAVEEYPIKMLENIVKSRLVSSTTYKRIQVQRIDTPREILIIVKFASQNRIGAMIDNMASITIIPREYFEENINPYQSEVKKNYNKSLREEVKSEFPFQRLAISKLIVADHIYTQDELERMNTDFIMNKGEFPFSPPTLTVSHVNMFEKIRENDKNERAAWNFEENKKYFSQWFEKTDGPMLFDVEFENGKGHAKILIKLVTRNKVQQGSKQLTDDVKKELLDKYVCPDKANAFWGTGELDVSMVEGHLDGKRMGSCYWVR